MDKPGTFAAKPEDAGMFYQWNRKKAWAVTGSVRWEGGLPAGETWKKENDPSPEGWRVPTFDEIKKLCDEKKVNSEWTTVNGVKGRRFTDKTNGNSIFLPAVGYRRAGSSGTHFEGYRHYLNGTLLNVDSEGFYWSCMPSSRESAYILHSCSDSANWYEGGWRGDGFSIRPVAE